MFHVDVPRVKGKMGEKGYNKTNLAKEARISRNTLDAYFKNPSKMPYDAINKLANILCENSEEAKELFFAN